MTHANCHGTPTQINGYPVVASKREWHTSPAMLPDGHIVVCLRNDPPWPDKPYVTWEVAYREDLGKWVANAGHYELSCDDAITDMHKR